LLPDDFELHIFQIIKNILNEINRLQKQKSNIVTMRQRNSRADDPRSNAGALNRLITTGDGLVMGVD
jgi:hypothetical protein